MATRTLPVHNLPQLQRDRARNNPAWFVKHHLGAKPWQKQIDILNAIRDHDFVAVRSCNGSGKTYTAALATLWWLMAHDEAVVLTTAPSERQVKELLWREIRAIYQRNKLLIGGKITQTRLVLSNKRFAYGFATDTTERFQGFHSQNILVIVDEASGVREFIFDAILGSLTSENSKMLMIGNPTSLAGTFYDAFHKNRKHVKTIHISAFDTPAFKHAAELDRVAPAHGDNGEANEGDTPATTIPSPANPTSFPRTPEPRENKARRSNENAFLANRADHLIQGTDDHLRGIATPKWAQNLANQRGTKSSAYQVRVLGEFPDEADDTLIALRLIEAAVKRNPPASDDHEAVMGVDVARFGNDQTVAIVRRGPEVLEMTALRRSDLMQTTGRVLDIARSHDVKTMHVDEVGLGGAVVDRAKELNTIQTHGVNGGTKSDDPDRYLNLRAQMFEGLKQRFIDGDISIPEDAELISQLASLTYRYTSRGQLQIESKDQIRSSGRQSPDKADALALAFASPKPKPENELMVWILGKPGQRTRSRRGTAW